MRESLNCEQRELLEQHRPVPRDAFARRIAKDRRQLDEQRPEPYDDRRQGPYDERRGQTRRSGSPRRRSQTRRLGSPRRRSSRSASRERRPRWSPDRRVRRNSRSLSRERRRRSRSR